MLHNTHSTLKILLLFFCAAFFSLVSPSLPRKTRLPPQRPPRISVPLMNVCAASGATPKMQAASWAPRPGKCGTPPANPPRSSGTMPASRAIFGPTKPAAAGTKAASRVYSRGEGTPFRCAQRVFLPPWPPIHPQTRFIRQTNNTEAHQLSVSTRPPATRRRIFESKSAKKSVC